MEDIVIACDPWRPTDQVVRMLRTLSSFTTTRNMTRGRHWDYCVFTVQKELPRRWNVVFEITHCFSSLVPVIVLDRLLSIVISSNGVNSDAARDAAREVISYSRKDLYLVEISTTASIYIWNICRWILFYLIARCQRLWIRRLGRKGAWSVSWRQLR